MSQDNPSGFASEREPARRDFLLTAGAVGAGLAVGLAAARAADPAPQAPPAGGATDAGAGQIPLRPFGRHADVKIAALGCGGHHLGGLKTSEDAIRLVHEAIDAGVNFFDNCWEYYNGRTENWLGRALTGRRDKVFLMTKVCTHGRSAALGMRMLEESLTRLQTDHLDLWQIHGVSFDNEPDQCYARGGAIEALEQAKKQGKVRFVGFTGHKSPSIHLRMIQLGYPFDSVQMPLNPFDGGFVHSFEKIVLPEANKRGIAVLGMKSMGGAGDAIKKGVLTAEESLRYAMSLPVAVTIAGMDKTEVLHQNLRVARGFVPMTAPEMESLRAKVADPAGDGRFEPYKTSLKFDNPQAREAHDFPLDPDIKEVKDMFEGAMGETPH